MGNCKDHDSSKDNECIQAMRKEQLQHDHLQRDHSKMTNCASTWSSMMQTVEDMEKHMGHIEEKEDENEGKYKQSRAPTGIVCDQ